MEREYEIEIPANAMAQTMVYAHRTRLSDFDVPAVEHILKPELPMPAHTVRIGVRKGASLTHSEHRRVPGGALARLKQEVRNTVHAQIPEIDLGDSYAMDMRFVDMSNLAHVIHDTLGPLRFIERTLAEDGMPSGPIAVLLPKQAPSIALRILEFAGIKTVCTDGVVRANLITISQDFNIALIDNLAHQPFEKWPKETPKKVFVSRRTTRTILNEEEVMDYLGDKGFTRYYMEDLSLSQQWSVLGNATEVVGIHGAGLAALGFCAHRPRGPEPRFRLTELFSAGFSNTCFRIYAAVLGGQWVGVRGKITPQIIEDLDVRGNNRAHDMASFEVDLESLDLALAYSPPTP